MDISEQIGHISQTAAHKLHVRSALNPILWLCAISSPLFLSFSYLFREYNFILYLLIISAIVPIFIACIVFVYFSMRNPNKLQSEDFQIRHESLQIIQNRVGKKDLSIETIQAIANGGMTKSLQDKLIAK